MTPLAVFFRILSRTSALLLGAVAVAFRPPLPGSSPRFSLATTEDTALRPQHTIQQLSGQLTASDPAVRARAACDLRERGDNAAAAIEALIALLPDAAPLE